MTDYIETSLNGTIYRNDADGNWHCSTGPAIIYPEKVSFSKKYRYYFHGQLYMNITSDEEWIKFLRTRCFW